MLVQSTKGRGYVEERSEHNGMKSGVRLLVDADGRAGYTKECI